LRPFFYAAAAAADGDALNHRAATQLPVRAHRTIQRYFCQQITALEPPRTHATVDTAAQERNSSSSSSSSCRRTIVSSSSSSRLMVVHHEKRKGLESWCVRVLSLPQLPAAAVERYRPTVEPAACQHSLRGAAAVAAAA
jgi:hypothetical protein